MCKAYLSTMLQEWYTTTKKDDGIHIVITRHFHVVTVLAFGTLIAKLYKEGGLPKEIAEALIVVDIHNHGRGGGISLIEYIEAYHKVSEADELAKNAIV